MRSGLPALCGERVSRRVVRMEQVSNSLPQQRGADVVAMNPVDQSHVSVPESVRAAHAGAKREIDAVSGNGYAGA
jgi:hypothetical protein